MSEAKLPQTVAEAIQWMFNRLDLENRKLLKNMKKDELILLHRGYGMGIRNGLDLWNPHNPLKKDPALGSLIFPDDISHYLIEHLWDYLQTIDLDTES